MKPVSPNAYAQLVRDEILMFHHTYSEPELGRLLYVQARKNYTYNDKGEITNKWVLVPHRCGYVPLEPQKNLEWDTVVYSIHLEAGRFSISRP